MNISPIDAEALFKAAWEDDVAALRELVTSGVDVKSITYKTNTVLRAACQGNSLRVLSYLLKLGADPNERSHYRSPVDGRIEAGFTPLMYVTSTEAAALLVRHGADVHARDEEGNTALMHSAHHGQAALVSFLKGAGANIHVRQNNPKGRSALELAKEGLAFWKALPNEENKAKERAAVIDGFERIVALLAENGAQPGAPGDGPRPAGSARA